jgi:hypothetical protein
MRAILLVLGWYYAERFQGMELVWPDRPPSIEEEMEWPVKPPAWWEPLVPLGPEVVAPQVFLMVDVEEEAMTKNRQERRLREESGARRLLRKLTRKKR